MHDFLDIVIKIMIMFTMCEIAHEHVVIAEILQQILGKL